MRLFIAVDLPPSVTKALAAICTGLPGARWCDPGQIHLTLRFLGTVAEDQLPAMRERLRGVRQPVFEIAVRGLGVFPQSRRRARVLWAGVTPDEPLRALKAAIDAALGPDPESAERGFSPHLTLARFRDPPGPELTRYLSTHVAFATPAFPVQAFHLYQSTLGADRARHDVLETVPLD